MERIEKLSKLGTARLWRNTSVRRLAALLLAFFMMAAVFIWMYTEQSSARLRQEWLDEQTAIIGRLSASNPAWADQWAKLLANPESLTSRDMEQGRKLAEQFGLTPELETRLFPLVQRFGERSLFILEGGLAVLMVVLAVLLIREYRHQLTEIRKLSLSLENTVKHNEPMSFRLYGEGELGLLANSVQELAIRLQKTIGQLHRDKDFLKDTVADISHQLKTPLSSLVIYIDLLREGNVDPSTAAEFLDTCRREADRMEWLTLTLLKIARLEANALPLHLRPASIPDTVDNACNAVRRMAVERKVSVAVEPPASASDPVAHDARWLAEAIANLLKNAVEHSPPGGTVTVSWSVTPVFVRFNVQDQGPGIAENHLPYIFHKFYRASSAGSGVGLGLALAKTIVERHGGMLSAASGSHGGARFVLTLPLYPLLAADIVDSYNSVREDTVEM